MEEIESTTQVINPSVANAFKENPILPCRLITSASQLQQETVSCDIKDNSRSEISNCAFQSEDQVVPEGSSTALGHCDQCYNSIGVEHENQIAHEASNSDLEVVCQIVPSEITFMDTENDGLTDIQKENLESSHWLATSQTDFKENTTSKLGNQLITLISNDDAESIFQPEIPYSSLEDGPSTHTWESIDNFIAEDFDGDINNTDSGSSFENLCSGLSHEETDRNNSQCVPEFPNDNIGQSNTVFPDVSICNKENVDNVSETSSFCMKYDKSMLDNSDVRKCLKLELKDSVNDLSEETKEIANELLHSYAEQGRFLDHINDSKPNLVETGHKNSINDQRESEVAGANFSTNNETSNREVRCVDQIRPQIQNCQVKDCGQSPTEIQDSYLRDCGQSPAEIQDSCLRDCGQSPTEIQDSYLRDCGQSPTEIQDSYLRDCGQSPAEIQDSCLRDWGQSPAEIQDSCLRDWGQSLAEIQDSCFKDCSQSPLEIQDSCFKDCSQSPSETQDSCLKDCSQSPAEIQDSIIQGCHHESINKVSFIRQRAIFKSPSVADAYNDTSVRSPIAKQTQFGKFVQHYLSIIILTFIAVTFVFLFNMSDRHYISPLNKFEDHVKNIKQTFPSQSEYFWKTVRTSVFGVFNNDEFKQPAVIIMASSTLHSSVASCIAKLISAGFESSWDLSPNMSVIDVNHLKHLDAPSQKLQLDNDLNSFFSVHRRKSLVVENLQLLDPRAALLFYSYCDNDNAPFKDVMILFTLYFNEREDKLQSEMEEKVQSSRAVESYLENMWRRDLPLDKVRPLINRMAANVVIVKGENSETFSGLCS